MEERLVSLCIFTPTGQTYTFRDVAIKTDNETVLVFGYKAMSDGNEKVGTFFKTNFIGYSVQG